jgi:hypothetical protein
MKAAGKYMVHSLAGVFPSVGFGDTIAGAFKDVQVNIKHVDASDMDRYFRLFKAEGDNIYRIKLNGQKVNG